MQQGRLARSGCAGHDDHARPGQPPRQLDDQLGGQPLPAAKHPGMRLVEREQPPVRAPGVPARARPAAAAWSRVKRSVG